MQSRSQNRSVMLFRDLEPSERLFVLVLHRLHFGRCEHLQIRNGEVVLPIACVRAVKFGSQELSAGTLEANLALKEQVVELIEYIRSVKTGEIRSLEIHRGLPFRMEVDCLPLPGEDVNA